MNVRGAELACYGFIDFYPGDGKGRKLVLIGSIEFHESGAVKSRFVRENQAVRFNGREVITCISQHLKLREDETIVHMDPFPSSSNSFVINDKAEESSCRAPLSAGKRGTISLPGISGGLMPDCY